MLALALTLLSLLLLPALSNKAWFLFTFFFICLTATSMTTLPIMSSYLSISATSSMDMMSYTLICLTLWISALMCMASLKIKSQSISPNLFLYVTTTLLITLILCFSSCNMLQFYIWFEASLVPTALLIMLWGYQPERIQASMYLMVYTVVASLPLLLLICKIYQVSGHLLMTYPLFTFPESMYPTALWLVTIAAFLVKLPLFSVHMWLPKAHVEAPVAGSMVLAAILLKLGGYGLIRVCLMFPLMVASLYPLITSMALMGAVLTGLVCLRQSDLKSLIAYSSVGHMGLMVAGVMSNTSIGMYGGLAMMIAHGLVSSALFCMANISYETFNTRSINLTRGLLTCMPLMSLWWFMFACANMAAPPSINLFSEILLITAIISHNLILAIPVGVTSFITAAYSLFLYSATNHGSPLILSNTFTNMKTPYMLMCTLHLTPVIVLITMPSSITL